ncbi:MAG: HAD-IA family hydrolase [Microlunatus sp.]|nr:HAD-IA family hydrolase [Microlunatus sp.]
MGTLTELSFDAVIFDMDGTLIDSTPAVVRAWTTWAIEHGVTADELAGHHGMPSARVVSKLLPDHRHEAAIDRINELEIDDVADIVVLPGAVEALAALRTSRNAIATSCTLSLAKARIAAAELVPPSILVTADQVAHGKPAPDPFLLAAARLGVAPERCLVVEDAPAGLTAAEAAGCYRLAVITTTPEDELVADGIVRNLGDVEFVPSEDGTIRVRPAT